LKVFQDVKIYDRKNRNILYVQAGLERDKMDGIGKLKQYALEQALKDSL